ncbi:MAG: hypothetical protein LBQ68_09620 [Clostridiales bacterium]|jgi:two-component system phosphate regulon sensor histidine kinase PhoR|nr:hypothetical protein [Clostridiales bacterium]
MRNAIYLRFVTIILLTALICASISAALYAVNEEKQTREHIRALCFAVSRQYEVNADADYLSGVAGGGRVTIVAPDGSVISDSTADAAAMENHSDREEIKRANTKSPVTVSRSSETLGYPFMYAAIKLSDGNILRLAQGYSGFDGAVVRQIPTVVVALLAASLIAAFIANAFAKRVIFPLEKVADDIAGGNYDALGGGYYEIDKIAGRIRVLLDKINRSQLETAAEKNKIEHILSNMAEGFVLLGADKKIQLVNNSAKKIFHCEIDILEQDISVLTRGAKIVGSVDKAITENYSGIFDLSVEDGEIYSVRVSPVWGEYFGDAGATILFIDVTADRKAQEFRSEFFANASHELKTPITSILGFSQVLENSLMDKEKTSEIYARISSEAQRMGSLISDILTISRLETGNASADTEIVNLREIAKEVFESLSPQAIEANISVTLDCDDVYISADRRQSYDMIRNLVENAIKYNVPDGTVNISVKSEPRGAVITVADTGIGIAPFAQSRIFERFYRVNASGRGKSVAGTGLGLAIVKHIVMSIGGEIQLESKAGKGTAITVLAPERKMAASLPGIR